MSEEKTTQEKQLSEAEMKERREKITAFYKENIKHLKVQKEYEELLRDVEKARVERLQAQMFMAQAYAAENESEEGKPDENPSQAATDFEKAVSQNNVRQLKKK